MSFKFIAASLLSVLVGLPHVASAYDFGCQYIWTEPSADNSAYDCIEKLPTENGGVLIPPLIPAIFGVILLVVFPVIFFGRCIGGCGSNNIRPGADCCCDGEEWDDVPLNEKTSVYPKRHVRCIKFVCLAVVLMCAAPVVLMPIGGKYGLQFWDEFYASAMSDVVEWAHNLKNDFWTDLVDDAGNLPPPLTPDSFESLQNFIDGARRELSNANDFVKTNVDLVNRFVMGVSFVPLVLTSAMLAFIMLSIHRVIPAIFMWLYYFAAILFSVISVCGMVLGVFFVLVMGEVDLQMWKSPGIFQWYAVPVCESEALFHSVKKEFTNADVEQSRRICREFITVCDDLPWSYPAVPGVSSEKPFSCTLTDATVNDTCVTLLQVANMINTTLMKPGADIMCPGCSVGDCPSKCPAGDLKDQTTEIAKDMAVGVKILTVIDKAFLHADCDVLLSQAIRPLKSANTGAWAGFLAAAGAGLGAVFLMFGIVLLCKGQKLFFPTPKPSIRDYEMNDFGVTQKP